MMSFRKEGKAGTKKTSKNSFFSGFFGYFFFFSLPGLRSNNVGKGQGGRAGCAASSFGFIVPQPCAGLANPPIAFPSFLPTSPLCYVEILQEVSFS